MEEEIIIHKEKSLKILAVQMCSKIGDKEANFSKITNIIEQNIHKYANGIAVIILPEVWAVGWKPSVFVDSAENLENSETIKFLSEIAKKYNVNIIGGSFITKNDDKYYNTCPVIDRQGKLITTYNKMHLFSYYGCAEGNFVENGLNPTVVEVDGTKIGLTICYDIRFPEIYRAYRKAGADVLVNMAAWPKSRAVHWKALSKARAIENQCFMIALTQSGLIEENEYNLGYSRLIDYNGEVISEIKDDLEGVMFAELEFEEMYEFREKCTVLLDIHDRYDVK